jgi:hypothetical protein
MITVNRLRSYADKLRSYNIVIDGVIVGKIKNGETVQLPSSSPGSHQIWVTIDWCRSPKLDFEYPTGANLNFECGSNLAGFKVFGALAYLFLPHGWCIIRQVSAPIPA